MLYNTDFTVCRVFTYIVSLVLTRSRRARTAVLSHREGGLRMVGGK